MHTFELAESRAGGEPALTLGEGQRLAAAVQHVLRKRADDLGSGHVRDPAGRPFHAAEKGAHWLSEPSVALDRPFLHAA